MSADGLVVVGVTAEVVGVSATVVDGASLVVVVVATVLVVVSTGGVTRETGTIAVVVVVVSCPVVGTPALHDANSIASPMAPEPIRLMAFLSHLFLT
jgi:hypothetical protein